MAIARTVVVAKVSLRVLGATVSALFLAQAVFILTIPDTTSFWDGCHWLGQGLLGLGVGGVGIYMEAMGSIAAVTKDCTRYLLNRIGLSLFYFWMGCYVMGGDVINSSAAMQAMSHASGIIAWIVAAGDLLISCCAEAPDDEEAGLRREPEVKSVSSQQSSGYQYGKSTSGLEPTAGARSNLEPQYNGYAGPAITAGAGTAASSASPFAEDDLTEIKLTEEDKYQPAGGWNTAVNKPFGY